MSASLLTHRVSVYFSSPWSNLHVPSLKLTYRRWTKYSNPGQLYTPQPPKFRVVFFFQGLRRVDKRNHPPQHDISRPDKALSGLSVDLILVWARSVLWSSLAALGTESEGQVCPNRCATGRRWVPALPAEATSQRLAVWATLEPVWFTRWRSLSWQVNKSRMGFFFLHSLPCLPSWVVLFVRTVLNFLVRHFGSVRTELGLQSQVLESLAARTLIRKANFNMQDRQCYRVMDPKNI